MFVITERLVGPEGVFLGNFAARLGAPEPSPHRDRVGTLPCHRPTLVVADVEPSAVPLTLHPGHLGSQNRAVLAGVLATQPANDAEYESNGAGHLLMYYAPFDDWRRTDVAPDHAAPTWAVGVRRLTAVG